MNVKSLFNICVITVMLLIAPCVFAQDEGANGSGSAELNGDVIEYARGGNVVNAKGNVVIYYNEMTLKADEVEFHRDTQIAHAKGNVRLITDSGEISGPAITFNYKTMKGSFNGTHIESYPYFGSSKKTDYIDQNHLVMENGYITTSDYDKTRVSHRF